MAPTRRPGRRRTAAAPRTSGPSPSAAKPKPGPWDYRLSVGPLAWRLTAPEGLDDWLALLARILELKPIPRREPPDPALPRIFFLRQSLPTPSQDLSAFLQTEAAHGLPQAGWRPYWVFPARYWSHPATRDLVCEVIDVQDHERSVESMVRATFPLMRDLVGLGGFPMHAALVARDEMGIGLVASGGTGKSTSSRRIPPPWRSLCDDTFLVLPEGSGAFEAHPFATWSDYLWKRAEPTWDATRHVPLKALFFLKQAESDKVVPIGRGEAAIYVGRSANEILAPFLRRYETKPARDFRTKVFDNACALAKRIPAYLLEISLEGKFWEEIERVLDR